jgi:hypothetical protein
MPTVLDETRLSLVQNCIGTGVSVATATSNGGAWADWVALGATPAEVEGRKRLALQATAKYGTQAYDGTRADDMAAAVTAALVVTA